MAWEKYKDNILPSMVSSPLDHAELFTVHPTIQQTCSFQNQLHFSGKCLSIPELHTTGVFILVVLVIQNIDTNWFEYNVGRIKLYQHHTNHFILWWHRHQKSVQKVWSEHHCVAWGRLGKAMTVWKYAMHLESYLLVPMCCQLLSQLLQHWDLEHINWGGSSVTLNPGNLRFEPSCWVKTELYVHTSWSVLTVHNTGECATIFKWYAYQYSIMISVSESALPYRL